MLDSKHESERKKTKKGRRPREEKNPTFYLSLAVPNVAYSLKTIVAEGSNILVDA